MDGIKLLPLDTGVFGCFSYGSTQTVFLDSLSLLPGRQGWFVSEEIRQTRIWQNLKSAAEQKCKIFISLILTTYRVGLVIRNSG
jgi:hypothetical protein